MPAFAYPTAPAISTKELVKVSSSYRSHVLLVLLSILAFITAYLVVLAISLLLVYAGGRIALLIVTAHVHWITLLLAAGLFMMVAMFFFYMIKFLFKIKDEDTSGRREITREEQPMLFDFIEKVCRETKAPFPKKIVLSAKVNASVYYNSSFLSMFFPVRKNLEIGLGLVTCVNISEFKAVVAHEFGHFSQSSTKLGSYVYRFHVMVYDLLYDNENWEETLRTLSSWHPIMRFFGRGTVQMARLAIMVLIEFYKIINKAYLGLSREMEFHADLVAVSVSGSKPIISALRRLAFGQEAYNYTLQGINSYCKGSNSYPENFFTLMQRNMVLLAGNNGLATENGLPLMQSVPLPENRLRYKDTMSTHPSIQDREANANRMYVGVEIINNSAWELFKEPVQLMEQMSKELTELDVKKESTVSNGQLQAFFEEKEKAHYINPVYGGFYDLANSTFALPAAEPAAGVATLDFEALFGEAVLQRLKRHRSNQEDAALLDAIANKQAAIHKFEFDGRHYEAGDAAELARQLKTEINDNEVVLTQHKQNIADWFYAKAKNTQPALAQKYKELMGFRMRMDKDRQPFTEIISDLLAFYHKELSKTLTEDDLPAMRKKLGGFYNKYINAKAAIHEQQIPAAVNAEVFAKKGYKDTLFEKTISNPTDKQYLEGFTSFYNAIETVMVNWTQLDTQVFQMVMKLQDEILKQLARG